MKETEQSVQALTCNLHSLIVSLAEEHCRATSLPRAMLSAQQALVLTPAWPTLGSMFHCIQMEVEASDALSKHTPAAAGCKALR